MACQQEPAVSCMAIYCHDRASKTHQQIPMNFKPLLHVQRLSRCMRCGQPAELVQCPWQTQGMLFEYHADVRMNVSIIIFASSSLRGQI